MKIYFAILAVLFTAPAVAAIGYVSNGNDIPSFGDYLLTQQNVKHIPGQDTDDWMAVAVSGPNKGGALDLFTALASYPDHKTLEQSAQGKVKYYELKCQSYSTGGQKLLYTARVVIRKCGSVEKTRKQAEEYMLTLLQPEPKS